MSLSLAQLEFCHSLAGEALLAAPLPDDTLAALTLLRKSCPPDQAAAVIEVREIRRRAARSGKFAPELARRLLGTDTLLQQASSMRLAVYVGRQLAEVAGGAEVWDLCCGLGGNAIGLARAGATVRGYDRAAEAVLAARHNADAAGVADRCTFTVADVESLPIGAEAVVHIDPDRRPTGRRTASLDDCAPRGDFLRSLSAACRAGAMKLSPALPTDAVADFPGVRIEHVSEDGVCKQLLAWWGVGIGSDRKATVVFGDMTAPQSVSLPAGRAERATVAACGQWLIEPDAAVIAAGATDDLAAWSADQGRRAWRLAPGLDWLSAEEPLRTPLARSFRILRTVAGRERDIAEALRDLDGGIVEIKPRGVTLDTDALQQRLRGDGKRMLSVLWCRLGSRQQAFIAERLTDE